MDNLDYTTDTPIRKKGAHLTLVERGILYAMRKDNKTYREIAAVLNCSPATVGYELKRGTPIRKGSRGRQPGYQPKHGQAVYEQNRKACKRAYKLDSCESFTAWAVDAFYNKGYSIDVCVATAKEKKLFSPEEIPSMKTVYNHIHRGLFPIAITNLPEVLKRSVKKRFKSKEHRRNPGRSIDERPAVVAEKKEFGHWEFDTVVGTRAGGGEVAFTLLEKVTRYFICIKIPGKQMDDVIAAMDRIREDYGDKYAQVFKTITADNGTEFARLKELEEHGSMVYFAHPYASWERGQNERHNRLFRRYVPKGRRFEQYTDEDILYAADCINALPRKILNYQTPEELFEEQLDLIYAI